MHFEYAVEPDAIAANWDRFKYLIEKFGFDKGRLISRFPKRWEALVYDAIKASDMKDGEIKKATEKLLVAKKTAFLRSGRTYRPEIDWLSNALEQDAKLAFRAILANANPNGSDRIVKATDVDEDAPLFQSATAMQVPRTEADVAAALSSLLISSKQILLVDPYFDVLREDYRRPLAKILETMAAFGIHDQTLQIHRKSDGAVPDMTAYEANIAELVAPILPDRFKLEIYEWRSRIDGEQFHDRYLLTECGGVAIGAGFSCIGDHQNCLMTMLPLHEADSLSASFRSDANVFDLVQPIILIHSDGTVETS